MDEISSSRAQISLSRKRKQLTGSKTSEDVQSTVPSQVLNEKEHRASENLNQRSIDTPPKKSKLSKSSHSRHEGASSIIPLSIEEEERRKTIPTNQSSSEIQNDKAVNKISYIALQKLYGYLCNIYQSLKVHKRYDANRPMKKKDSNETTKMKEDYGKLKIKEHEWRLKEKELRQQIEQMESQIEQIASQEERIRGQFADSTHTLQTKIEKAVSDKAMVQDQLDSFMRKQQEQSFKQMESARWLPDEDSRIIGDLDRLKRDMRTWSKGNSKNSLASLQSLTEADFVALLGDLANVCIVENSELPQGLSETKGPALLLSALLAHSIYVGLFMNPFFCLEDRSEGTLSRQGLDSSLNEIYQHTQRSNETDAHIWRSQTLRLLLPPLRDDSSTEETNLHHLTEDLIANVAKRRASQFLDGPARHLLSETTKANCVDKIHSIYQKAATLSYRLWTRRTTIKCVTLKEMGDPRFDSNSGSFLPHSSVRHSPGEDKLEGRPISVLVHPLLLAYGTDDADDYDQERVWATGEVWLDSKTPLAS